MFHPPMFHIIYFIILFLALVFFRLENEDYHLLPEIWRYAVRPDMAHTGAPILRVGHAPRL